MSIYGKGKFEKLFEENEIKHKIISTNHLKFVEDDINTKYKKGIINDKIFNYYLKSFDYEYKNKDNQRAIIITAKPKTISVVFFHYKGRKLNAIIPPTYIYTKDWE